MTGKDKLQVNTTRYTRPAFTSKTVRAIWWVLKHIWALRSIKSTVTLFGGVETRVSFSILKISITTKFKRTGLKKAQAQIKRTL